MSAKINPNLTEFATDVPVTSEEIGQTILETSKDRRPLSSKLFFVTGEEVKKIVAEIAYYKAEKRGFQPGYEMQDWIESERDVLRKFVYLGFEKAEANSSKGWE